MKKKRPLTLIEIMVVLFIITIITSVIGVNMKGTMKEGKAFKSEKGSKQVYDILTLEIAKNPAIITSLVQDPTKILNSTGLVADAKKILVDGWGEAFVITYDEVELEIKVTSKPWLNYLKQKGLKKDQILDQYPWVDPNAIEEELYTY